MKLTLKTVLIFSVSLTACLNLGQLISSNVQHKDAFAPGWAYQNTKTEVGPTVPTTKASLVAAPAPSPAPVAQTASTPAGTDQTAAVAATLSRAGLKPDYAALYLAVQAKTGTPWQLLAAVHKIETGQRGDTAVTSYAGAQGPMQFMPATFNNYALDGDANGTKQIGDLDDAMYTAGRYLAAGGADRHQYATALYHYNHSWTYVSSVMATATRLGL